MEPQDFQPSIGMGNAHLQSILCSSRIRRWLSAANNRKLQQQATRLQFTDPDGHHLVGWHNTPWQPRTHRNALVIMIHGWEGCHESSYMLSAAAMLLSHGYQVLRLNLWDHGGTGHLNPGPFHGGRIDPVAHACQQAFQRIDTRQRFLLGFSMGGNFVLRSACHPCTANSDIHHAIAISPVIDPAASLSWIEGSLPIYPLYFMRKWRRSLSGKAQSFPELYQHDRLRRQKTIRQMTRFITEHYTDYPNMDAYLQDYSITGNKLHGLHCQSNIVHAADDPILPASALADLQTPPKLNVWLTAKGGHCGFLTNPTLTSWAEQQILNWFAEHD